MKLFPSLIVAALVCVTGVARGEEKKLLFPDGVGSNFVFLDLGRYATQPTAENWDSVKTVLVHYHEHPDQIRSLLKTMRGHGQTKIALMLWYIEEGDSHDSFAHVICPHRGKLPVQVERNIHDVLRDIADSGFDTVIMRLAAQGAADPLGEKYDPVRADDSWKLFENVYVTCEKATKGTKLNLLYDLGCETMGHPYSVRPGAQAFLKLMWTNYVKKYPPAKTIGFSFNHAYEPGTTESLRVFQESGVWPAMIGVDIYENPDKFLGNLAKDLKAFGRPNQPVIIEETFRNNRDMAEAFAKAQAKYELNLRMLLQWPLTKGAKGHSDDPRSTEIDAYRSAGGL